MIRGSTPRLDSQSLAFRLVGFSKMACVGWPVPTCALCRVQMQEQMLPSAWLTAGGVPPGVAAYRAVWRQEPNSDLSDDSVQTEDEDEVVTEPEERLFFSSKTGTGFKGVYYDRGGAPEGHKSSLAEPYMVARRDEELLKFKTALSGAVFYREYVFAKHGRTAKGGRRKAVEVVVEQVAEEVEEVEVVEAKEAETEEAEEVTFSVVKLRMLDRHTGLPEGWACSTHWATNELMYKRYTGPNGEVRTDQSLRKERYGTKSTESVPEVDSAPAEAHVPAAPRASQCVSMPEQVAASVQQDSGLEPDGIIVSARPRASPLDGRAWQPDASQQGAEGEKRQRASPISFTAGPAPPPSVLHDEERRAQAVAALAISVTEQQHQRMAALSPPESEEAEAVDEAMEAQEAEEEAAEEEEAEEETAVEGAAGVEMDDERASVAAEKEASETDEMEELPEDVEEPPVEARTGGEQTGVDLASWDDNEELEPETGHGNPRPPMDRNALTRRCRHTALACTADSPSQPPMFACVAAGASKSTLSTRACTS